MSDLSAGGLRRVAPLDEREALQRGLRMPAYAAGKIPMGRRGTAGRRTARRAPDLGRVELAQRGEIAADAGQAAHGSMTALADAVRDAAGRKASID